MHATTVCWANHGLILAGPSGSGKSGLALELMAFGATLVSDDMTLLQAKGTDLVASAPKDGRGRIEVREIGILAAQYSSARVAAAVDLTQVETRRLPEARSIELLGRAVPLLHKPASAPVAAKLLHYLRMTANHKE